MYTPTASATIYPQQHKQVTPVTGRGRALYTTAWFLTGIQPQVNCDDPDIRFEKNRLVRG